MQIQVQSLVSVVLPVYNGEKFLSKAIESVLRQSYSPLEILLVDDGSTDSTAKIALSYPQVRYFYQENRGPSAARNLGVRESHGEFVAFIDSDDIWPEDKLEWQVAALLNDSECQMSIGRVQWEGLKEFSQPVLGFQFPVVVCRRTLFQKIGLLNESLKMSEDVDWFMRVREAGTKVHASSKVCLRYRRHAQNMTADTYSCAHTLARALRMSLDRRRAQGIDGDLGSLKEWAQDEELLQFMDERRN